MDKLSEHLKRPAVELLLSVADDKFMLGHRNADWTGLAPILEEDIAFSALSQDEVAHASVLYEMAAQLEGTKADRLAFAASTMLSRASSSLMCASFRVQVHFTGRPTRRAAHSIKMISG